MEDVYTDPSTNATNQKYAQHQYAVIFACVACQSENSGTLFAIARQPFIQRY